MNPRILSTLAALAAVSLLVSGCGGGSAYGSGGSSSSSSGGSTTYKITISPSASTIAVNGTQQYDVTAKDSSGNTITGLTFTWSSSNTAVATVNGSGLAVGVSPGTAQITASYNYSISGHPYTVSSNLATLTVSMSAMVMGIASNGRPLNGALVGLMDAAGKTEFALTGENGRFELSTDGLVAPYVLRVTNSSGQFLYSIANNDGITNVNLFSDALSRLMYWNHGTTVDNAFSNRQQELTPSDLHSFEALERVMTDAIAKSLLNGAIDPSQISLIHGSMAVGNGETAALLDSLQFIQANHQIRIDNPENGHGLMLSGSSQELSLQLTGQDIRQPVSEIILGQ